MRVVASLPASFRCRSSPRPHFHLVIRSSMTHPNETRWLEVPCSNHVLDEECHILDVVVYTVISIWRH
jgi:hypothetical protein